MPTLRLLYDGWPLVYDPNGPAALHLLALLERLPPDMEPVLALPGPAPAWLTGGPALEVRCAPTPDTGRGRLRWQQSLLQRLAGEVQAHGLHLTTMHNALFGRIPSLISPSGYDLASSAGPRPPVEHPSGLAGRLQQALAQGGLARTRALLWPDDLPEPSLPGPVRRLPPLVCRAFYPPGTPPPTAPAFETGANGNHHDGSHPPLDLNLPETYVLYGGPQDPASLRRLLEIWTWAAGPVGQLYPLLLPGLSGSAQDFVIQTAVELNVQDSVLSLPVLAPNELAGIFRSCSLLLHPAPASPWGGPLRQALACGKALIAWETPLTSALVGPAAYLAPPGDTRALGAALLTVLVEESVMEQLQKAARQRTAEWQAQDFNAALAQIYAEVFST